MYEALYTSMGIQFPSECVWKPKIPTKNAFLLWEVWWNRIPTINNLLRRGLVLPSWCCLCRDDVESADHLFLHCPWSKPIWDYFIRSMGIYWVQPELMRELLLCWPNQSSENRKIQLREIWLMVPTAICGTIWEERNRRTFQGVSKNSRNILDGILAKLHSWLFLMQAGETPPLNSWIFDWNSLL